MIGNKAQQESEVNNNYSNGSGSPIDVSEDDMTVVDDGLLPF